MYKNLWYVHLFIPRNRRLTEGKDNKNMRREGRKEGRKERKKERKKRKGEREKERKKERKIKYSITKILCINAKKFKDGYTIAQCQTVHILSSFS